MCKIVVESYLVEFLLVDWCHSEIFLKPRVLIPWSAQWLKQLQQTTRGLQYLMLFDVAHGGYMGMNEFVLKGTSAHKGHWVPYASVQINGPLLFSKTATKQ